MLERTDHLVWPHHIRLGVRRRMETEKDAAAMEEQAAELAAAIHALVHDVAFGISQRALVHNVVANIVAQSDGEPERIFMTLGMTMVHLGGLVEMYVDAIERAAHESKGQPKQ